jgi:hypothetical protein
MRTAALLVLTLTAFRPAGASATTTTVTTTVTTSTSTTTTLPPTPVTAVCPLGQDPCLVTSAVTINPGSTLDFGQRALVVTPQGSLDIGSGLVKVFAGSLDIQPKGAIVGGNGWIIVTTTGPMVVEKGTGTRPPKGTIDVSSSDGGGEIDLTGGDTVHAADISIAGILNANGTGDPSSCDHCVAGACTSSDAGLPGVTCRLTDIGNALRASAPPELRSAAIKRKLTVQIGQAAKLVGKARESIPAAS